MSLDYIFSLHVVVVVVLYSVLMYRDDIQLEDVKESFWHELHALTSNG